MAGMQACCLILMSMVEFESIYVITVLMMLVQLASAFMDCVVDGLMVV